jgi:hypothetical protein
MGRARPRWQIIRNFVTTHDAEKTPAKTGGMQPARRARLAQCLTRAAMRYE